MTDDSNGDFGNKHVAVHDISESCPNNKAVQIVEINREGDVDSDLLIVTEEALESLRGSAIDLKSVIEEYSEMLVMQNYELKQEQMRWRGANVNGR